MDNELKVTLEKYTGLADSVTGKVLMEQPQFRVFAHHSALWKHNGKIQVGLIGTHDNANFMPTSGLDLFSLPEREWIVAQAKEQHGKASKEPFVPLPPEPETEDEAEEEETET